jgi:autophagy-related protein 2
MAYFLPSFFQKRLLRYALSRLELVDTDTLDLDSLGIRWGQRSTFELRDVGLKLVVRARRLLPRYIGALAVKYVC